jgi:PAS domain S-box-containing protein
MIDDNEDDYVLIKYQLGEQSNYRYELEWVNNFEEAAKAIAGQPYDIYLIDNQLKDGEGLELLRLSREQGIEQPILMLTGFSNPEYDSQALKYGADDYIIKSQLSDYILDRTIRYNYENYLNKKSIRLREIRYRNLFESSIDPIMIVNTDFVIQECNQSTTNLLRVATNRIYNHSFSQYFEEKESFEHFKHLTETMGIVKKFETNLINNHGVRKICSMNCITLFDLDNEVSGYQIVIRDRTKEKRNEIRSLRAEKLGMTGRIARSIAHEVRNPLTNINLAIDQLKEEIDNIDSMAMLDIIDRSSSRINKLITELLNSSKPTEMNFQKASLNKCVQEAIELAEDRIKLNDIELETHLDKEIEFAFDFSNMKIALLNIFINAIEAMDKEEKLITVNLYESLPEYHIKITDNGKGLEKNRLTQLFDPFFTGKTSGMGLGLTSTQNIINQHGGNIDVDSELGEGTEFTINLPKTINHERREQADQY